MTPVIRDNSSSTYALAHFLATTGPDQYARRESTSSQGQSSNKSITGSTQSRLTSRLRSKWLSTKKTAPPLTIGSPTNVHKPKHVPLINTSSEWSTNSSALYPHQRSTPTSSLRGGESQAQAPPSQSQTQTQRDSGIYSSDEYTKQSQSSLHLVQFPPPPLKKRVRHVQTQTPKEASAEKDPSEEHDDDELCHHCYRPVPQKLLQRRHRRRLSSPAALPTQDKKEAHNSAMTTDEAKLLLGMIETLKLQLAEEQRSRLELEQSLQRKRT